MVDRQMLPRQTKRTEILSDMMEYMGMTAVPKAKGSCNHNSGYRRRSDRLWWVAVVSMFKAQNLRPCIGRVAPRWKEGFWADKVRHHR